MNDLANRIALITGAGGGIGRLTAHRLAANGAAIAAVDLNEAAASNTATDVSNQHHVKTVALAVDVSSSSSVTQMRETVEQELGPVNILVNAAGFLQLGGILDVSETDWDQMMAVNLKGVFLVTQSLLPGMLTTDYGRIINISSLAGKVGGLAAGIHYVASKGALLSFTKALAKDVGRYGMTANCVCPYPTETEMIKAFSVEQLEMMRNLNPMQRLARPEEIAATIAFLATPEASFINAEMLDVDGGFTAD
jgi:NAD(P)-dependent dehydrogenase (short-subunit alcohol dehydrogenase family)